MRFEVGTVSGVFFQFEIGTFDRGLLDFSESHFFCPSFWCVSIVFEVH